MNFFDCPKQYHLKDFLSRQINSIQSNSFIEKIAYKNDQDLIRSFLDRLIFPIHLPLAAMISSTSVFFLFFAFALNTMMYASPLDKRVQGPAPCSQSGNGKFGTFKVTPSKAVSRNQPITIHYQQNCAEKGNVYPSNLFVSINGPGNDPLQLVASLPIPKEELGKLITLDTAVPDGPLPFGNGSDLTISGIIQYIRKDVQDVTYLFQHQQPFSINETAPPFQGES